MNITTDEMKSMVQEWFAQALGYEELGEIYFAVRSEAEKQFLYIAESISEPPKE